MFLKGNPHLNKSRQWDKSRRYSTHITEVTLRENRENKRVEINKTIKKIARTEKRKFPDQKGTLRIQHNGLKTDAQGTSSWNLRAA